MEPNKQNPYYPHMNDNETQKQFNEPLINSGNQYQRQFSEPPQQMHQNNQPFSDNQSCYSQPQSNFTNPHSNDYQPNYQQGQYPPGYQGNNFHQQGQFPPGFQGNNYQPNFQQGQFPPGHQQQNNYQPQFNQVPPPPPTINIKIDQQQDSQQQQGTRMAYNVNAMPRQSVEITCPNCQVRGYTNVYVVNKDLCVPCVVWIIVMILFPPLILCGIPLLIILYASNKGTTVHDCRNCGKRIGSC